jgi:tetratricopeptide (TPR) repeat protein
MILKIRKDMNRRLLFILPFFLFCISLLNAQNSGELFKKGNQAYEKGDFKTAIETYQSVLKEGFENGEVLYNLGNAYFKTGQFASAILFYERARRYMPNDKELSHNIAIANLRIPDRIEKVPKIFIFEWWESLKNLFPVKFYQIFIFLLFTGFIAFIILFFWSKDYSFRKRIFFIGIAFSLIFLIFTFAFISKTNELEKTRTGVIFTQSVDVKSSPDDSSTTLYIIHMGLKVEILDDLNDWYKVSLPDGKTGWLKNINLEII